MIEAQAKSETARAFYARYGFRSLLDGARHLYLPMGAVRTAFAAREAEGA